MKQEFIYSKEMLWQEFREAENADLKSSKRRKNQKYDNRIQFFKDHIELRAKHPEYYGDIDINFQNLLTAWSAPNPRDHFYMTIFGKSYAEKRAEVDKQEAESLN